MEGVYAIVYCDGDMISSSEKILFECPSVSKVVIISEDMLFDVLKKTIIDATGGCITTKFTRPPPSKPHHIHVLPSSTPQPPKHYCYHVPPLK